jgi:CrcB protein
MLLRWMLIFAAGGGGSLLRYLLAGWIQRSSSGAFPWGTFTVNLLGCGAIGFLASLLTGPLLVREEYRLAILVGLLGGFTTFSSFSWETLTLAEDGQWWLALANILLSNGLGLCAAWLGARVTLLIYGT